MFKYECLRAGQARAYQDTIHEYTVTSDMPEADVKAQCLKQLGRGVNPDHVSGQHGGACGFPFGLSSFYSFSKLVGSKGKYRFIVVEPYTG